MDFLSGKYFTEPTKLSDSAREKTIIHWVETAVVKKNYKIVWNRKVVLPAIITRQIFLQAVHDDVHSGALAIKIAWG